jgi:hypothetical protein
MSWCRVCGRYHLFGACPKPELQDPALPGSRRKDDRSHQAVASSDPPGDQPRRPAVSPAPDTRPAVTR